MENIAEYFFPIAEWEITRALFTAIIRPGVKKAGRGFPPMSKHSSAQSEDRLPWQKNRICGHVKSTMQAKA